MLYLLGFATTVLVLCLWQVTALCDEMRIVRKSLDGIPGKLDELIRRQPTPLWGATPAHGPSGCIKPYQQYVNPTPVALVTLNEAGDWVPVKK